MNDYYLTVRSVTYAQRGEAILNRRGIRCSIRRTPRFMEEQGCGYCLRIRNADAGTAVQILTDGGVPIRKIYAQRPDGQYDEVVL